MTDDDDKLTAWWLGLAPSRQEELLSSPSLEAPWLAASIAEEGLVESDVDEFLRTKREIEPTRDSGLNPKPESS